MIKICLFEDDDTMRSLLKTLFEIEGFSVISANAEENNVAFLIQNEPDVLLLDVYLTHQNGIDILRSIRENPATKFMRVIMSSGMDLKEICLQNGADGFLLKPYMPDELINMINNLFNTSNKEL